MLTLRSSAPWYLSEIDSEKFKRHKLERHWRKSWLHIDRQLSDEQCEKVRTMVKQAKRTYYSTITSENACNQKVLFNTIDCLAPATDSEVFGLIRKSALKSCCLDPIPASLLGLCLEDLLSVITRIIK